MDLRTTDQRTSSWRQRWTAIKRLWTQPPSVTELHRGASWALSGRSVLRLKVKATICLLFGWRGNLWGEIDAVDGLAYWNSSERTTMESMRPVHDWDELLIAKDAWHYDIIRNSDF